MDRDENGSTDELTYADAGVDIDRSEAATAALVSAIGEMTAGGYAGLVDIGDRYLGLTTDGVGTKLLVAAALDDYSTIGIDCIAMNVNDLVAAGVEPLAFVDYLAVDEPNEAVAEQIGQGLADGADEADILLVGGETAVMPEVIDGLDLAGTCAGLAPADAIFDGSAEPGDALVGFPSTGVHSNGLTLARRALTRSYDYDDPFPADPDRSVGEVLLEPTRIYTGLLDPMRAAGVDAAAHITGGGVTNLQRMGEHRYVITDPLPAQPVFDVIQTEGGISDEEMYRTFNMGIGFVAALDPSSADRLVGDTDGRVIGHVEDGSGVHLPDVVV